MNILITGANRGIGLGLTKLCVERGDQVMATARHPEQAAELHALQKKHGKQLQLLALDIGDIKSVHTLTSNLGDTTLDLLINNAGVYGEGDHVAELDWAAMSHTLDTNALGPLRVCQAMAPRLKRPGARVVNITSQMGSIADNRGGGSYGYRMSKAALNMASKTLALEWESAGQVVVTMHPGWVRTDMGGSRAPLTVEKATEAMLRTIDELTSEQSGHFLNYDGRNLPW